MTTERIVHKARKPKRMLGRTMGRRLRLSAFMLRRSGSEGRMGDTRAKDTEAFQQRVIEQRHGRVSFAPF